MPTYEQESAIRYINDQLETYKYKGHTDLNYNGCNIVCDPFGALYETEKFEIDYDSCNFNDLSSKIDEKVKDMAINVQTEQLQVIWRAKPRIEDKDGKLFCSFRLSLQPVFPINGREEVRKMLDQIPALKERYTRDKDRKERGGYGSKWEVQDA